MQACSQFIKKLNEYELHWSEQEKSRTFGTVQFVELFGWTSSLTTNFLKFSSVYFRTQFGKELEIPATDA